MELWACLQRSHVWKKENKTEGVGIGAESLMAFWQIRQEQGQGGEGCGGLHARHGCDGCGSNEQGVGLPNR